MKITKSSEGGPVYNSFLKVMSDKHLITLYHGTSSVFLKDILANGLISFDSRIYLADSINEAKNWASQAVDNLKWRKLEPGKEVVLQVKVDPKNISEGLKGHFVHTGNIPASSIKQII